MSNEEAKKIYDKSGYYYCDHCDERRSPTERFGMLVCGECGNVLMWCGECHACSVSGGADRAVYHAEGPCKEDPTES